MQQKIERLQIGELVSLDRPLDHATKMLSDPVSGDGLYEQVVPTWLDRDQADIGGIALVAGARVRDIHETNSHWMICTEVLTTDLSIRAGQ